MRVNGPRFILSFVSCIVAAGLLAGRGLAADIDDLQRCYFGNHWSLVTPGLEPQAGVLIITGKEGETFTATLEKVGGHNGQQIVARGRGTVKDDGTLRWVGHVFAEDGTTELIRVAFRGVLSVTGKAIGGGTFSARGAFPDGFEINDHSFYQWETPCPFTLPPPQ